ncbi:MAG: TatD family hydrolase, partial [Myxococcota bacterium]
LMIETDAPYLLPRTLRPRPKSRRNEPCFLPHVLDTVARCADRDVAEIARATTATASAFFGLATRSPSQTD